MLHHSFQDYDKIQGSFSSYEAALQDFNDRGCYHPHDPLDPLDDESDENESEDKVMKKMKYQTLMFKTHGLR